ncbi:6-chlorohydroxyquinol-1,2-dioxygenase [Hoeflea sp. WL0058]|uniref:6-chlorohydroxyquinol-1,2-dioxygenase n=1 Tax=Flavimaribacter sediminis TaxID=2865987 RepID=A0AAE2ZQG3_9HYPH|nr:dioxygenase [Flavimaribacter sediminis]MBW8640271.1 6-chlorohydroxyquinol-1,2-dioxygenase [Flavimaribacter sediminis]
MRPVSDNLDFNERNASAVISGRLRPENDRLGVAVSGIVSHIHALVSELRPSREELREIVAFLTDVGHATEDHRQEWVLLFDVLGVSTLVETMNSVRPAGATSNTPRGPFYRADAPILPRGASISLDARGEPLTVHGRVTDLDGNPLAGALLEVWQPNADGIFENQQPDLQPEFNLRGKFVCDDDGGFIFRTVKPGGYNIPCDGPVGRLLQRLDYPLTRPAHLHFRISAQGYQTLVTQIFDADDPSLTQDAILGVRRDLVGEFRKSGAGEWELAYSFVMATDKTQEQAS